MAEAEPRERSGGRRDSGESGGKHGGSAARAARVSPPAPPSAGAISTPAKGGAGPASGAAISKNAKRFQPLKEQLTRELVSNPLDIENPPTQKSKDKPERIVWVPEFDGKDETNPRGQNSVSLLNAIKKWELD